MTKEKKMNLSKENLEKIFSMDDNVDTIKMKEHIIKTQELPWEMVKFAYKNSKSEQIKEALLNKYLTVYPQFMEYAFSPNSGYKYFLVKDVIKKKAKKFSEKYLKEILNIIKSEEKTEHLKTDLLKALIDILEQKSDLSNSIIKNLINLSVQHFLGMESFNKLYQGIKENSEMSEFFLRIMIESQTFERLMSTSKNSKFLVESIIKDIVKNINPTKLINIITNLQKRPNRQLFLLNYIPNDARYLKAFMYLSRNPDERIKNLVKEKIKSLKS